MTAVVIVVILFAVLLFLAPIFSTQVEASERIGHSEPPRGSKPGSTWERNHFINKHLHRDDKKHERHRRNQYPQ